MDPRVGEVYVLLTSMSLDTANLTIFMPLVYSMFAYRTHVSMLFIEDVFILCLFCRGVNKDYTDGVDIRVFLSSWFEACFTSQIFGSRRVFYFPNHCYRQLSIMFYGQERWPDYKQRGGPRNILRFFLKNDWINFTSFLYWKTFVFTLYFLKSTKSK